MKRFCLAALALFACQPTELQLDETPELPELAFFSPPPSPGLWSFGGGDGVYVGARAACEAFAKTYEPPYKYDHLELTGSPDLQRCYVKPQGDDGEATVYTTVGRDTTVRPDEQRLKDFKCAVKSCDRAPLTSSQRSQLRSTPVAQRCSALGEMKHACVEQRMSSHPEIRPERSYDMSQDPPKVVTDAKGNPTEGYGPAKKAAKQQGLAGPLRRPDAIAGNGAPYEIYEAKFP